MSTLQMPNDSDKQQRRREALHAELRAREARDDAVGVGQESQAHEAHRALQHQDEGRLREGR